MPRSMVSNTALRSNNRSTKVELESRVSKTSLTTYDYAVSKGVYRLQLYSTMMETTR